MCYIKPGAAGACDRYANHDGVLVRVDPHIVLERTVSHGGRLVPFQAGGGDWDGKLVREPDVFVTAIGAGTTYPDYKPAPFIVSSEIDGVDMVTVVTEGIFSYCGVKVKIDTDRHLGPGDRDRPRAGRGDRPCHHRRIRLADAVARRRASSDRRLEERRPRHLRRADGPSAIASRSNSPSTAAPPWWCRPAIRRSSTVSPEERMRVGCGSATIGMFAKQWHGKVDEVVVVDDHITGVLSEHQAGKLLDIPDTGIKMKGRRSTPGRYFQVAEPGTGWGGTNISDPLSVLGPFNRKGGAAGPDHADGVDHRRACRLLRARRGAAADRDRKCRSI